MARRRRFYIYSVNTGFSRHMETVSQAPLKPGRGFVRYDARWSSVLQALMPPKPN